MLVAADDNAIVGFTMFGAARDDDVPDGTSEVYSIYVHPDALVDGCRAGADVANARRHWTADLVVLWVLEDNDRARRFYEFAGFVADGAANRPRCRAGRSRRCGTAATDR